MNDIYFRSILPSDFEVVKNLHDEFFPVKYSDSFYKDACNSVGIKNGKLFTSIATTANGAIVGFILAQIMPIADCEDDYLLDENIRADICYILTLGVVKAFRRTGLASALVNECRQYSMCHQQCGAVYLHVLHSNDAAIKFYEKNSFEFFKELQEFYHIGGEYHTALVYVLYINGGYPPLLTYWIRRSRIVVSEALNAVVSWIVSGWRAFSHMSLSPTPSSSASLQTSASRSHIQPGVSLVASSHSDINTNTNTHSSSVCHNLHQEQHENQFASNSTCGRLGDCNKLPTPLQHRLSARETTSPSAIPCPPVCNEQTMHSIGANSSAHYDRNSINSLTLTAAPSGSAHCHSQYLDDTPNNPLHASALPNLSNAPETKQAVEFQTTYVDFP